MSKGNLSIPNKKANNLKYGLMIVIVAAFWGFGNPALKVAVEATSPLYALVLRFFIAFLFFIVVKFKHIKTHIKSTDYKNMFIVAIFIAGAYIAAAYSMIFTTATNAGFFMATGVIYTPLVSYFVLRHKINVKSILPIGIVAVGIYFLSTATGEIKLNPGDAIALLCAMFGAGMYVFTGKFAAGIDPIVASTLQFLFVGLICFVFAIPLETMPKFTELGTTVWMAILFMAIFCTCLAYFIQNLALKHITPTYMALVFTTEPIFGAGASFFLLGETLNGRGLFGAAIIMVSIIWASLVEE